MNIPSAQIQGVSVEYEGLKKALASSETAKEIDETEKRLKVRTVGAVRTAVCVQYDCPNFLARYFFYTALLYFERMIAI